MRFAVTLVSSILMIFLSLSFSPRTVHAEIIDKILAQVGERIITQYDLEIFAPGIVKSINSLPEGPEKTQAWRQYYDDTLDFMIYDTTLQMAASRIGITATDREIEDTIALLQQQNNEFRGRVEYILEREGTVTPELYLFVKQIILTNKVSQSLIQRAVVTEQDIREYLKEIEDLDFGQTEYNVQLVFLPDAAVYEQFQNALRRGTFEEAALSVDQQVINMGWVTSNQLIPEMGRTVETMRIGDTSAPFTDEEERYTVMKLSNIRTQNNIPEDVRSSVTYTLQERQLKQIFDQWLDRNRQSILVHRYDQ